MTNQLRLGIDAFMSATDNAADCNACMVFSAFHLAGPVAFLALTYVAKR